MNQSSPHTLTIFAEALECLSEQQQAEYLNQACGDDAGLRASVEELLRAHHRAGKFLDGTAPQIGRNGAGERLDTEKPGAVIGPYELLEQIGEGGFGDVYRAQQREPLNRLVALKIIKPGMDTRQTIWRFEAERQVLAMMDHPNIAHVLDAGETTSGRPYFVMELVSGSPISKYCDASQLPIRDRLRMFMQVCQGVGHAHQKGVIHRDLKPSNILVARYDNQPVPKVIDFGVAKALNHLQLEKSVFTQSGQLVGTLDYMSPEQARLNQLDIDMRSDIYSLGVVLYELLTGTTPVEKRRFQAAAFDEALRIIVEEDPPTPSTRVGTSDTLPAIAASRGIEPARLKSVLRGDLDWIVMKALEKDRNRRYETAGSFAADIERYLADEPVQARPPSISYRLRKFARRNRVALTAAGVIALTLVLAAGISAWQTWRATQVEIAAVAKDAAYLQIPIIEDHIRAQTYPQAFALLNSVEAVIPDDPRVDELYDECSWVVDIQTDPSGATVSRKPAGSSDADWQRLGTTPIKKRLPRGVYHWMLVKPGYVTAEALTADNPPGSSRVETRLIVDLDQEGDAPAGMVRVRPLAPGFFWGLFNANISIPPYWIDRYEVTNRRFKAFVDAGGYSRQELWEHPFEKDGEVLSCKEAMELFRDTTGKPGPVTWADGIYLAGQDDFPVSGVSWYEAAAFAKFEGKHLPSVYHWNGAAGRLFMADAIIARSNFGSAGLARAGKYRGLSHCGAYDMGGNVKEWCFNSAGGGLRYLLGGAWDEESYMFATQDARRAVDRLPNIGFRCVKYLPDKDPPQIALQETLLAKRDDLPERPLSDLEFKLVRGHFHYETNKPFNAKTTQRKVMASWTHERHELDAAYGDERLVVNLYLPAGVPAPFQTIVYWPGATGFFQPAIASPQAEKIAFLINSGRALAWPIYRGTYERRVQPHWEAEWKWEYAVQQANDLRRSIDYLEADSDKYDLSALGYYGYSWGAAHAVRAIAIEDRIKAAVFVDGGLPGPRSFETSGRNPFAQLERDPIHYLSRITIPVLMLNGRYDVNFPVEESQRPLFELLGTDDARKRYVLTDNSHVSAPSAERIDEALNWFDRHLGPVRRAIGPVATDGK